MELAQYFNIFINMNKEFLYMQKLAGLITESEFKERLKEIRPITPNTVTEKIFTIGDWFDKSNYNPDQKLGVHRAYNYDYGLILGFDKDKGKLQVILAPQIISRNGKKFAYKPRIYTVFVSQIEDVSKPGTIIKYDESKVKENLNKLNKDIKLEKNIRGEYRLPGLNSGPGDYVDIDVTPWVS